MSHTSKAPSLSKKALGLAVSAALCTFTAPTVYAKEATLEEILVTARKRQESLQDAPVTVSAFTKQSLKKLNLNSVAQVVELVPAFNSQLSGTGSSGTLHLRGIGSNSSSAAFDSAVSLNYDGIVSSSTRLINNSSIDLAQIEVLKGPQSLYFGKSASAGVVSVTSNDPTDEFEASLSAGYEFEMDGTSIEGVISGPLTDNFQARLAFRTVDIDERVRNTAPGVANPWRGEESTDARLTLAWQPTEDIDVNFKYAISQYDNDGPNQNIESFCPDGAAQDFLLPGAPAILTSPSGVDCNPNNRTIQQGDPNAIDQQDPTTGVPFTEQDVDIYRLKVDWQFSEQMSLTSVTSYIDMDQSALDSYSYDVSGVVPNTQSNFEETWAQEFRLESNFDGPVNFLAGLYYQDRQYEHLSEQRAFALSWITGTFAGPAAGVDPVTGRTTDWIKRHPLDAETLSLFTSVIWDITDQLEMTVGARYTDEEKSMRLEVPYMSPLVTGALGPALSAPSGFVSETFPFEDENVSPEVSLTYKLSDDITLYGAYKTGFKSGGFDNSFFPVFANYLEILAEDIERISFESETVDGFEMGLRSTLHGGDLRFNVTGYHYIFKDLQRQILILTPVIAWETQNVGEITSQGVEADITWATPVEGLIVRSSLAYTDTKITDENIIASGLDLDGSRTSRAPLWAGNFGFDYSTPVSDNLVLGVSGTAYYSDEYSTAVTDRPNEYIQDSFWRGDLTLSLSSADNTWEFAVIGRNITDEYWANAGVDRLGAQPQAATPTVRDKILFMSKGREITARFTYNF